MSRLKSPRPVRRRETTETSLDPVQSSISVLLRRENELSNKPEVINVCVRLKKPHSRYEDLIQHLDEKYPYKEKIIGFECIDTYEKVKVQDRLSRFRLQKIRALYDDSSKFPGGILSVEIHQIQELQFSSVFTTVLENHGFKVRAKIVNDIKKRSVVGDIQETGLQTRSDSEAVVWETKNCMSFRLKPAISTEPNLYLNVEVLCGVLSVAGVDIDLQKLLKAKKKTRTKRSWYPMKNGKLEITMVYVPKGRASIYNIDPVIKEELASTESLKPRRNSFETWRFLDSDSSESDASYESASEEDTTDSINNHQAALISSPDEETLPDDDTRVSIDKDHDEDTTNSINKTQAINNPQAALISSTDETLPAQVSIDDLPMNDGSSVGEINQDIVDTESGDKCENSFEGESNESSRMDALDGIDGGTTADQSSIADELAQLTKLKDSAEYINSSNASELKEDTAMEPTIVVSIKQPPIEAIDEKSRTEANNSELPRTSSIDLGNVADTLIDTSRSKELEHPETILLTQPQPEEDTDEAKEKAGGLTVQSTIRIGRFTAVVRYIGLTKFEPGVWIGLEFQAPVGRNNGSVKGVRYFHCRNRHGVFVKAKKLGVLVNNIA